jgi:hypothetical protein
MKGFINYSEDFNEVVKHKSSQVLMIDNHCTVNDYHPTVNKNHW